VVKLLCYNSEDRWFDPIWCQWIFHCHKILLIALWPWGRLSLSIRIYFLGGKGGRWVRLTTYHQPVPLSRNLGILTSWSPLGLSRPVMGTALPLTCLWNINVQIRWRSSLQAPIPPHVHISGVVMRPRANLTFTRHSFKVPCQCTVLEVFEIDNVYKFAGSGWKCSSVLILLASCMAYTIAVCTVKNSWWWTEELYETCRVLTSWSCSQTVWHIPLLCVQWKTPDDGQRNCTKNVEF
jgi:hypothetical protein